MSYFHHSQRPLADPDRTRKILAALPGYVQGRGQLRQVRRDGVVEVCVAGAACDVARLDGADIEVLDGAVFDPNASMRVEDWLGCDLHGLRVDLRWLPTWLRERAQRLIDTCRRGDNPDFNPCTVNCPGGIYPLTVLNDIGMDWAELADVIRVAVNVDRHLVSGTPEWETAQAADTSWVRERALVPA